MRCWTRHRSSAKKIYITAFWRIIAFWAEDNLHTLLLGINGDLELYDYFHTVGGSANTAYAIYRPLGIGCPANMNIKLY